MKDYAAYYVLQVSPFLGFTQDFIFFTFKLLSPCDTLIGSINAEGFSYVSGVRSVYEHSFVAASAPSTSPWWGGVLGVA